jgi:hypothetical protein
MAGWMSSFDGRRSSLPIEQGSDDGACLLPCIETAANTLLHHTRAWVARIPSNEGRLLDKSK